MIINLLYLKKINLTDEYLLLADIRRKDGYQEGYAAGYAARNEANKLKYSSAQQDTANNNAPEINENGLIFRPSKKSLKELKESIEKKAK